MSADVSLVMSCGAAVTSGAGPAFIRIAIIGRIAIGSETRKVSHASAPLGYTPMRL
jgi:hypothetical protein